MPLPTAQDVHVDQVLSDMSVAFTVDEKDFVCHRMFPYYPSKKQSNKYPFFPKGYWFRTDAQKRVPGAESAGKKFSVTYQNYFCEEYALHYDLPDQIRENADSPFLADQGAVKLVAQDLMLLRESLFIQKYMVSTAPWTFLRNGAGGDFTRWDLAGSDPLTYLTRQLDAVQATIGKRPNRIAFAANAWSVFQNHSLVVDRIKYTMAEPVGEEIVARYLGVKDVYISRVTQNTANEGQADSMAFMASNVVLLAYAPDSPTLDEPSAGYCFGWTPFDGVDPQGAAMKQFRMEWLKSDRYEGEMCFDFEMVSPDCGLLMYNVLQTP